MVSLHHFHCIALVFSICAGASPNRLPLHLQSRNSYPYNNSSMQDVQSTSVSPSYKSESLNTYGPPMTTSSSDSSSPLSGSDINSSSSPSTTSFPSASGSAPFSDLTPTSSNSSNETCTGDHITTSETTVFDTIRTDSCSGITSYYENYTTTFTLLQIITVTTNTTNTSYTPPPTTDPLPWCTEVLVAETAVFVQGNCPEDSNITRTTTAFESKTFFTSTVISTKKTTMTVIPTAPLDFNTGKSKPEEQPPTPVDNSHSEPVDNPPSAPVDNPPSAPVNNPPSAPAPVDNPPSAPVDNPPSAPVDNPPSAPVNNPNNPPSAPVDNRQSPSEGKEGGRASTEGGASDELGSGNSAPNESRPGDVGGNDTEGSNQGPGSGSEGGTGTVSGDSVSGGSSSGRSEGSSGGTSGGSESSESNSNGSTSGSEGDSGTGSGPDSKSGSTGGSGGGSGQNSSSGSKGDSGSGSGGEPSGASGSSGSNGSGPGGSAGGSGGGDSASVGSFNPVAVPPLAPTPMTAGGVTLSVAQSRAIISGTAYAVGSDIAPTTVILNDQTVSIGPGGIGLGSTTIFLPSEGSGSSPSSVITAEGLTLAAYPTEVVIDGTATYQIGMGATPTTAVINGQTVSLGPEGIGLDSTTIPVPADVGRPIFSAVTAGDLTFSINPTEAVISGTTYQLGTGASPTAVVINGQSMSLGPDGIGLPTTTIPVPKDTTGHQQSVITAGELTFSINPTEAVISGTTYPVGAGAITPITTVISGQTISFGPGGVGLPTTTVPVPNPTGGAQQSTITAGGLTFSVNPTEAIISGTTYPIGSGATTPTTTVIDGQTVSLGPDGVSLPTTTIIPPSPEATGTGTGNDVQPFTGGGGPTFGTASGKGRTVGALLTLVLGGFMML